MIYLLCKHDIISVPAYAEGIYHRTKCDIISKIYHPFRKERISLQKASFVLVDKRGFLHGTPGETRTHYLALRRRTLYPGELREQITLALYRKFLLLSTKRRHIFLPPGHILAKENEGREAVCRGSKAK